MPRIPTLQVQARQGERPSPTYNPSAQIQAEVAKIQKINSRANLGIAYLQEFNEVKDDADRAKFEAIKQEALLSLNKEFTNLTMQPQPVFDNEGNSIVWDSNLKPILNDYRQKLRNSLSSRNISSYTTNWDVLSASLEGAHRIDANKRFVNDTGSRIAESYVKNLVIGSDESLALASQERSKLNNIFEPQVIRKYDSRAQLIKNENIRKDALNTYISSDQKEEDWETFKSNILATSGKDSQGYDNLVSTDFLKNEQDSRKYIDTLEDQFTENVKKAIDLTISSTVPGQTKKAQAQNRANIGSLLKVLPESYQDLYFSKLAIEAEDYAVRSDKMDRTIFGRTKVKEWFDAYRAYSINPETSSKSMVDLINIAKSSKDPAFIDMALVLTGELISDVANLKGIKAPMTDGFFGFEKFTTIEGFGKYFGDRIQTQLYLVPQENSAEYIKDNYTKYHDWTESFRKNGTQPKVEDYEKFLTESIGITSYNFINESTTTFSVEPMVLPSLDSYEANTRFFEAFNED